ncbi:MAG: F-type H+-transporting ATPase subunit delta [Pseudomonadota bacterium]|jgi:F-type H+-transporting ATPase subunit delta|nr:F-type H+-transporting ATPase subunit delta [Pseudomonadota bacterium]
MADNAFAARPYAQAVFEIARATGDFRSWSAFLQIAAGQVLDPELAKTLQAPGSDVDKIAVAMADVSCEQLDAGAFAGDGARTTASNFLRLLAENRRLAALPDIAGRYEQLRAQAENTLDVVLTSASAVDEGQQSRIAASLKQRLGREIRISIKLDSALIGGARLQIGDRVIDGSVRTGLDKLATALSA